MDPREEHDGRPGLGPWDRLFARDLTPNHLEIMVVRLPVDDVLEESCRPESGRADVERSVVNTPSAIRIARL